MAQPANNKPAAQVAMSQKALVARAARANAEKARVRAEQLEADAKGEGEGDEIEGEGATGAAAEDGDDEKGEPKDDADKPEAEADEDEDEADAAAIAASAEAKTHPQLALAAIQSGQTLSQFKASVAAVASAPKASRLDRALAGASRLGPDGRGKAEGASSLGSAVAARIEKNRAARSGG